MSVPCLRLYRLSGDLATAVRASSLVSGFLVHPELLYIFISAAIRPAVIHTHTHTHTPPTHTRTHTHVKRACARAGDSKAHLDADSYDDSHLVLHIQRALNAIPSQSNVKKSAGLVCTDPYVRMHHIRGNTTLRMLTTTYKWNNPDPVWDEALDLGADVSDDDMIRLEVYHYARGRSKETTKAYQQRTATYAKDELVGLVQMSLGEVCSLTGGALQLDASPPPLRAHGHHPAPSPHHPPATFATLTTQLVQRPQSVLLLFEPDQKLAHREELEEPCHLHVAVIRVPTTWPAPVPSPRTLAGNIDAPSQFPHHVMMMTRGTRGDIQPFVSVARGLASEFGWMVTIVTELRYKPFIKEHAELRKGCIRFRPSGGDTAAHIDPVWASFGMQQGEGAGRDILQQWHALYLRSEREYYDSEPAWMFWAQYFQNHPHELPLDAVIYGSTTLGIGSIIASKLGIKKLGFLLQPMWIMSAQFLGELHHTIRDRTDRKTPETVTPRSLSVETIRWAMAQSAHKSLNMDEAISTWDRSNPHNSALYDLRMRRGLGLRSSSRSTQEFESWSEEVRDGSPLIVPVHPSLMEGTMHTLPQNVCCTEFSYLDVAPSKSLPKSVQDFIEAAKAEGAPVVAMCMAAMPITRDHILSIATRVADLQRALPALSQLGHGIAHIPEGCQPYTSAQFVSFDCVTYTHRDHQIIVLMGHRDSKREPLKKKTAHAVHKMVQGCRLLEVAGCAFAALFSQVSCVVVHGSLGSVSEALRAGIPIIVTGGLLMDQRFWGLRCHQLGVSPGPPSHASEFHKTCVQSVDAAVAQDSPCRAKAAEIATGIRERIIAGGTSAAAQAVTMLELKPREADPPADKTAPNEEIPDPSPSPAMIDIDDCLQGENDEDTPDDKVRKETVEEVKSTSRDVQATLKPQLSLDAKSTPLAGSTRSVLTVTEDAEGTDAKTTPTQMAATQGEGAPSLEEHREQMEALQSAVQGGETDNRKGSTMVVERQGTFFGNQKPSGAGRPGASSQSRAPRVAQKMQTGAADAGGSDPSPTAPDEEAVPQVTVEQPGEDASDVNPSVGAAAENVDEAPAVDPAQTEAPAVDPAQTEAPAVDPAQTEAVTADLPSPTKQAQEVGVHKVGVDADAGGDGSLAASNTEVAPTTEPQEAADGVNRARVLRGSLATEVERDVFAEDVDGVTVL